MATTTTIDTTRFADALPDVLRAADWISRASVLGVCKEWRTALLEGEHHYAFLCERLRVEHQLYCPTDGPCPRGSGARLPSGFPGSSLTSEDALRRSPS